MNYLSQFSVFFSQIVRFDWLTLFDYEKYKLCVKSANIWMNLWFKLTLNQMSWFDLVRLKNYNSSEWNVYVNWLALIEFKS